MCSAVTPSSLSSKRQQVRSPTSCHPRWPRPCSRASRPWWSSASWVGSAAPTPAQKRARKNTRARPHRRAFLPLVDAADDFAVANADELIEQDGPLLQRVRSRLAHLYGPAVRCKPEVMIWRLLVLRFCIRPLSGAFALLAIMDIRAHLFSFASRP